MSASSHETIHSSNFSIFSSQSQISNAMSAELLEDMSIIDDLYNEYSDADDPNEMANESRHQEREQLLYELFQSEIRYTMDMVTARDAYLVPLRKQIPAQASHGLLSGRIVCTDQELRLLFGNLEQLLFLHQEYLSKLESRFRIWGPTQLISDVFRQLFPVLKEYTPYMKAFPSAVVTYERLYKVQVFRKFTKTCQDDSGQPNCSLFQLLQAPLKRIGYYVSAVQLLVKYTDHLHPDYAMLTQCAQRLSLIAADVQPLIDNSLGAARVMDVYTSIQNSPSLVTMYRRLVKTGELVKLPSSGGQASMSGPRHFFLFNDMLIWGRAKDSKGAPVQYKGVIDMLNAKVRAVGPERTERKNVFELVTTELQSTMSMTVIGNTKPINYVTGNSISATYLLATNSQEEQQAWIQDIQKVIDTLQHQKQQARLDYSNKLKSSSEANLSRTSTVSSGSTTGSDGFDLKGKPLKSSKGSSKLIPTPPNTYMAPTNNFVPRYM
ncbi:hypothetical protein INT43_001264 [Umbelopsis isabellina]|uniref:Dbl homology domain-containing protein n=1 Tax=Mortierella isabellina TaxID=91625 RepID=A0A8H7PKB3_MORIS|nr:hypothetical protein INT43_001264 [Umbelopsis isabellina]